MSSVIGDESRQFVAHVEGGTDHHAVCSVRDRSSSGMSTLLTDGDPTFDPVQVAEGIIAQQAAPPRPTTVQPSMLPDLLASFLPIFRPVWVCTTRRTLISRRSLRASLGPGAAEQLAAWGWDAGAYRQFDCDVPPATGLRWIELGIHRFGDAAAAAAAVPYFAHARTVGTRLVEVPAMPLGDQAAAVGGPSELGPELTVYVSAGQLLLRATGIAQSGDPRRETGVGHDGAVSPQHLGTGCTPRDGADSPAHQHPNADSAASHINSTTDATSDGDRHPHPNASAPDANSAPATGELRPVVSDGVHSPATTRP